MHKWLHYIPSRIAAVLWTVVALFLPSNKWQEMSQVFFDAATSLPPRPLMLAIAGRSLNVSLGGPTSVYDTAWRWQRLGARDAI